MRKRKKEKEMFKHAKILLAMILIVGLILPAYAVNPADSASFITKSEFDSAFIDFNTRLVTFETGVNTKIDAQVTSYLERNDLTTLLKRTTDGTDGTKSITKDEDGIKVNFATNDEVKSGDSNNHAISPETLEYFYKLVFPVGYTTVGKFPPGGDASGNGLYNTVWTKRGTGGYYLRIAGSGEAYASTVSEQLPNIKGHFYNQGIAGVTWGEINLWGDGKLFTSTNSYCGLYSNGNNSYGQADRGSSNLSGIDFNANKYSNIYKDGGKVQPNGYNVFIWERTS